VKRKGIWIGLPSKLPLTIPFQDLVDALPPGAVHEAAVYENDTQCLVPGHASSFLHKRMQTIHLLELEKVGAFGGSAAVARVAADRPPAAAMPALLSRISRRDGIV
jgi:hypothetical protein